jgi:two-component system cell cycle response regulator
MNPLNLVLFVSRGNSEADPEDETFIEILLGTKKYELESGISYIIKEKRNDKGMELFMKMISKGYSGLYITRHHPKHINRRFETNGMDIIWLSNTMGENYLDPHNLSSLLNIIKSFVEKNERTIILLDGVEYLMINNVYLRLVKLIEQVKDLVILSNSILLISLDDRAFEPKELSLLEKGLKAIDT